VVEPAAVEAANRAQQQELKDRDDVRDALARDLEAAHFAADRAFRQYDATDPQNRLVAAELELRWNRALVACNSDIGIALMYHEACVRESFA